MSQLNFLSTCHIKMSHQEVSAKCIIKILYQSVSSCLITSYHASSCLMLSHHVSSCLIKSHHVPAMSHICFLSRERWDGLSIFKSQSNITISPALRQPTNKQPTNQLPKYRASPDFLIYLMDWDILANQEFGNKLSPPKKLGITFHQQTK